MSIKHWKSREYPESRESKHSVELEAAHSCSSLLTLRRLRQGSATSLRLAWAFIVTSRSQVESRACLKAKQPRQMEKKRQPRHRFGTRVTKHLLCKREDQHSGALHSLTLVRS